MGFVTGAKVKFGLLSSEEVGNNCMTVSIEGLGYNKAEVQVFDKVTEDVSFILKASASVWQEFFEFEPKLGYQSFWGTSSTSPFNKLSWLCL